MKFVKMHGCGNSFIVAHIAQMSEASWWRARAAELCRAHFGVGADGVLLPVLAGWGSDLNQPIEVVMINPDGSGMGMCGNGIRCVLRYLFDLGVLPQSHTASVQFVVEGRHISTQSANAGKLVQVGMGRPVLVSPAYQGSPVFETVSLGSGEQFSGIRVSMGNPHFVIFDAARLSSSELARIGSSLEQHQFFPDRTNVELVRGDPDGSLSVQVWERGAGATLACGTGACATLVAAVMSR
ncbi:MAG: diaminopimelate epimerase, partial [Proteobacteria bacterium]|nr:diaminopimelate epimerase [Pseudomonadota bacterium]